MRRGLIRPGRGLPAYGCEIGPNAHPAVRCDGSQNGSFSNLAEFPVLQMMYRQGDDAAGTIPTIPARKPMLIGRSRPTGSSSRRCSISTVAITG